MTFYFQQLKPSIRTVPITRGAYSPLVVYSILISSISTNAYINQIVYEQNPSASTNDVLIIDQSYGHLDIVIN